MLIALRDISVGEHVVKRGQPIPVAAQAELPAGRADQLKAQHLIVETSDELLVEQLLAGLTERVERLENERAGAAKERAPLKRKAA